MRNQLRKIKKKKKWKKSEMMNQFKFKTRTVRIMINQKSASKIN